MADLEQTCPACGSRSVIYPDVSREACSCRDCNQLFVPEHRVNPDVQMCDDCAFRPGSPERQDKYKWAEIIEATIVERLHPFHCHKGLRCSFDGHNLTYQQPEPGQKPMTPCAGWRAHLAAYQAGTPARNL
jgi:gentisate 1,2-dioxygenase